VVHAAVALVPVILFLTALQVLDSFKLVRVSAALAAIGTGGVAAIAILLLHSAIMPASDAGLQAFSRYVAPVTEETIKAAFIVFLIARRRVGFLVDAAVQGFAVGAGFALVENAEYLRALSGAPLVLWLVRGLGTAVLHGATTAIFAMVSRTLADRSPSRLLVVFWPGWAAAVVIHAVFNHLPLPPAAMTMLQLAVLPLVVLAVFKRSERETREWVGAGLDLDLEVLQLVTSDTFAFTRFGSYLRELRAHFPGPVVADMFCLLRLELELSVQAKAMLMAREAGLALAVDDDLTACLAELEYLQAAIGRTGMLALKPLQVTSHRDEWHRYLLAQAGPAARKAATARRRLLARVRGH
jgi:RsiW-degrading membrane proteinase PrsW (M82 family)